MPGQFYGDLTFSVLRGLDREAASGQGVLQLNSNEAAVRSVANPPDVAEVRLLQFRSGHDLRGIRSIDISRTERQFDGFRACTERCERHGARPSIEVLQFLHVIRAVVHILAEIGIFSGTGCVNAASGCADDVFICYSRACRVECFQQNPCVHLHFFKSRLRNDRKSSCHFLSLP